MAQKIKVYRIGDRGMEFEEINFDEAERLLEEVHARGSVVLNKKGGEIIDRVGPDIEELLIVNLISGG